MKLIPFACPHCAAVLDRPKERDHIISCPTCRRQLRLEPDGLLPQPVSYATPAEVTVDKVFGWRPFWVVRARVEMTYRSTQRAHDDAAEASHAFWSQPRNFYIPADELSLARLRGMALKLQERQPELLALPEPPADIRLPTAALTADDARQIADLLIVILEARRRDVLKSLEFKLTAEETELWAVPGRAIGFLSDLRGGRCRSRQ